MNRPSSTATAGVGFGWLAAIMFGVLAMVSPETYARVPPGMEAGVAVGIGFVAAYLKKENVLDVRR